MTRITDEARAAGLAALHADADWHKPDSGGTVWRANYKRAVDLVLEAALPRLEGATPAIDEEALAKVLNVCDAYERQGMGSASDFDKGAQRAAADIHNALLNALRGAS